MTTEISRENEQYIQRALATGEFASRNELLDEAVTLLRRKEQLLSDVNAGIEQLDKGEYAEYDEDSLDSFLKDARD